jgi:hypothetical protein
MSDTNEIVDLSLTHQQFKAHVETLAIAGARLASAKEIALSYVKNNRTEETRREAIRLLDASNEALHEVELALKGPENPERLPASMNALTSLLDMFLESHKRERKEILREVLKLLDVS